MHYDYDNNKKQDTKSVPKSLGVYIVKKKIGTYQPVVTLESLHVQKKSFIRKKSYSCESSKGPNRFQPLVNLGALHCKGKLFYKSQNEENLLSGPKVIFDDDPVFI